MIFVTKSELPKIQEYVSYLKKIWKSSILTNNGPLAQQLEKELKSYLDCENLALVTNGTLALQLAFRAMQLSGEVITTPFTFAATSTALIYEGLKPVFADIDSDTFTISPSDVRKKITKRTSAILAVHVYGNPCHMEELAKIAREHNLKLIYDAAHAFGVEYKGRSVMQYGDVNTLSFHATKVFNTIEGGAIITKTKKAVDSVKLLRNFGIVSEEDVEIAGINAKMNEFQAAMGLCNIKAIEAKIKARKSLYEIYAKAFSGNKNIRMQKLTASKYNYSYMPVVFRSKTIRDRVHDELVKSAIKPRKYFYPLISDFKFIDQKRGTSLPVSKSISDGVLCLPLYSSLNHSIVKKIAQIALSNA